MTNEELILKDLTARLPYNVKFPIIDWDDDIQEEVQVNATLYSINKDGYVRTLESDYEFDITSIKPYLFPMSSMTEEQYDEFEKIVSDDYLENIQITKEMREKVDFITHFPIYCPNVIDWFDKNHFDYRGLIEKGLAIDATNLNVY